MMFVKCWGIMGHNWSTKLTLFKFTKKFQHGENGQFGPELTQIYTTLYLMIRPYDIFEIL